MNQLKALNHYFLKYKFHFFSGIAFVIISNVFGVLYPQVFRHAVDLIKESVGIFKLFNHLSIQDRVNELFTSYLVLFGALVLALALLKGVFMFFMRQTIIVMSRRIEFDMKNVLYEKYQALSMAFFKRNNTGDLMARISEDVGKVRMYLGPGIMYAINLATLFTFVIYAMIQVNAELTFYVLLPLPILSFAIYYVNSLILKRSKAIQEQLAQLTTFSQEAFSGIRVIKSYARENSFKKYFSKELDDFKAKNMHRVKVDALFFPLMMALIGISTILTIYVGGIKLAEGTISAGNIAEFVIYINMLTWPVAALGWVASMVQQAAASQARINEFMAETPDIDKTQGLKLAISGAIEFNKVSFTYPDSGILALDEINLKINPGETLGIVGKTGSGKSTFANLLTRLYDVSNGTIKIDNKDLRALEPSYLRSQIGYVPQEVFLFSDSILNNIKFGGNNFSETQAKEAAKNAAIYDNIMEFPEAFETQLGERGITLSGGQKQRLAIARAIIRKPKIFIFDDCLSAMDTNTEKTILENLQKLTNQTTSIIISHRISSVMNADQIIVLDEGKIVEQGKHFELLEQNGYYANINEKQQI